MSTITIAQFKDERLNTSYKLLQTGDSYQIRYRFGSKYDRNSWRHEIESFSDANGAMISWAIRIKVVQQDRNTAPELFEAAQAAFDKANIYLFGRNEADIKSQHEAIDLLANAAPEEPIYESHEAQG